jgi:hypothetical protein
LNRASRHLLVVAALALLALALPSVAHASPGKVIRDCVEDGDLDRDYSNSDLRKALDNLPSDIDEYTDCREVIGAAVSSGRGGGGNGGGNQGGGGPGGAGGPGAGAGAGQSEADFLNSPEEQAARAQDQADLEALTDPDARDDDAPPIDVGGQSVKPGANGLFDLASSGNELPTPLLFSLIALGLMGLTGAFLALRSGIPALARIPVLSKIPKPPRVRLPSFRR